MLLESLNSVSDFRGKRILWTTEKTQDNTKWMVVHWCGSLNVTRFANELEICIVLGFGRLADGMNDGNRLKITLKIFRKRD